LRYVNIKTNERPAENTVRINLTSVVFAVALLPVSAGRPSEEYRVKGAYLLNFAKFVEWPDRAFQGPRDPIAICILGTAPFTAALDVAAHAVVVENRSVTVRQIQDTVQARQCHIVFLSASERRQVRGVIDAVRGGNVLTVGETDGFVASGGVIELSVDDSRIRMKISTGGAKKAGLRISAKLLSLAQSGDP
jgi:hypothetical protein